MHGRWYCIRDVAGGPVTLGAASLAGEFEPLLLYDQKSACAHHVKNAVLTMVATSAEISEEMQQREWLGCSGL